MADEKYDGSVRIGVELDDKGFQGGSAEILKAIQSLEKTINSSLENLSKSISDTLSGYIRNVDTASKQAEKQVSRTTHSASKSAKSLTKDYQELEEFVRQQEKNLEKLKKKQQEYSGLGLPEDRQYPYKFSDKDNAIGNDSDYKNINEQIKDYEDTIKNCKEELAELEASGRKYTASLNENSHYTEQYTSLLKELKAKQDELSAMKKQYETWNDDAPMEMERTYNPGNSYEIAQKYGEFGVKKQIVDAEKEISDLQDKITELEQSGQNLKIDDSLKNLKLTVQSIDFTPLDISQFEPSVQKYAIAVNKANFAYAQQKEKLRELQAQLNLLNSANQTLEIKAKAADTMNRIEAVKIKLQEMKLKADEAAKSLQNAVASSESGENVANTTPVVDSSGTTMFSTLKTLELFSPVAKKIGGGVLNIAKGFGKVGSAIKKAFSKLNLFNKAQKNGEALAKKFVKQFTRIFTMLKGRAVRKIVSAIVSGISSGIQELAKVDEKFNHSISMIQSRFKQLSYTIVSAFAPLFNLIAPVLDRLSQLATSVIDKVSQLMAALTGQSTYKKAVYNYSDYADSLANSADQTDKLTDGTDNLADSTKKLNKQLATFDELNVLDITSDSDIGSSLIDNKYDDSSLNQPPVYYEEVPISFDMSNLSQRIKESFANGDFSGIGEELGEILNLEIDKIDPTKIGSTIARIINSASSFAIGFLSTVHWKELASRVTSNINTCISEVDAKQLGNALAEILNTIFTIALTFGEEFDWKEAGRKLADFFNELFEKTDWSSVGKTINTFIIGLLDMILTFLDNLDNGEISKGIGELVKEIDFIGIITRLGKILGKALVLAWDIAKEIWLNTDIMRFWTKKGEEWGRKLSDMFKRAGFDKIFRDYKKMCGNIKSFFDNVFKGDWESACIDLVKIFVDKMNIFIGKIESMLRIIFGEAIPSMLDNLAPMMSDLLGLSPYLEALLNVTVQPVAGDLAESFRNHDYSLPRIEYPHFAQGTVVPPNYGEFAAILGDNKRETEVVSPLSTMKQAMIEAMAEVGLTGGNNDGDIVINIDSREIFRVTKKEADKYKRMHGKPAFS